MKATLLVIVVFACSCTISIASDPVEYRIRELPTLPGHVQTNVYDLSNTGKVLGTSIDSANHYYHVLWSSEGTPTALSYEANAINNLDQTVGRDSLGHIAIRDPDGQILATYVRGVAIDINDLGAILGYDTSDGNKKLCYWSPDGTKYEIGLLPGCTGIDNCSMNNRGEVVGIDMMNYNAIGFYWSLSTGLLNINEIVGCDSVLPSAINDNGTIVGRTSTYGVKWRPETGWTYLTSPSGLFTRALDINNIDQVVGHDSSNTAIIWNPDGSINYLSSLVEGQLGYAKFINDNSVIAGRSNATPTHTTGVIWDPVPEPSGLVTLISALLVPGALLGKTHFTSRFRLKNL